MAMREPAAMRVDPTEATIPESFEVLRSWMAIDTAARHQPVWPVVNLNDARTPCEEPAWYCHPRHGDLVL